MCGLPGSGKTTYAEKFALEKNATVFILDRELFKKFGKDFPSEKYPKYELETKKAIIPLVENLLKENKDVILDYGFWKKEERDFYIDFAKNINAKAKIIFFEIPLSILKDRIKQRNSENPDQNHIISDEMMDNFYTFFEFPKEEKMIVINV